MTVVVELERVHGVIRSELDAHRDAIASLVDAELERIVLELVAERLAGTNGAARVDAKPQEPERAGLDTTATAGDELCRDCGVEPHLSGRRICSSCRGKRAARKRKAAGAAESDSEPRPVPESDPAPAGAQGGLVNRCADVAGVAAVRSRVPRSRWPNAPAG